MHANHPENGRSLPSSTDLPFPKAVFFDLDGTLYRGGERVPGADKLIADLEQQNLPCWFLTNNSSRTPDEVASHLMQLGIPAAADQVITSAMAAADYIKLNHPDSSAYVIGETGLLQALAGAGVKVLQDGEEQHADVVVQGIDRKLSYGKLASAVRHMLNGAAYILTNPDRLLPSDGGLWPGAGSIAACLQAASGKEPVVIGKPSAIMMDYALSIAGIRPEEVWVVGDNPFTDIAAAVQAGCPSVLTLTGLCAAEDWEAQCRAAGVFPDKVCAGLDELAEMLQINRKA